MRRIYMQFCKLAVGHVLSQYFFDNFYELFLQAASDKVVIIRIEFAKALLHVRPYLDKF